MSIVIAFAVMAVLASATNQVSAEGYPVKPGSTELYEGLIFDRNSAAFREDEAASLAAFVAKVSGRTEPISLENSPATGEADSVARARSQAVLGRLAQLGIPTSRVVVTQATDRDDFSMINLRAAWPAMVWDMEADSRLPARPGPTALTRPLTQGGSYIGYLAPDYQNSPYGDIVLVDPASVRRTGGEIDFVLEDWSIRAGAAERRAVHYRCGDSTFYNPTLGGPINQNARLFTERLSPGLYNLGKRLCTDSQLGPRVDAAQEVAARRQAVETAGRGTVAQAGTVLAQAAQTAMTSTGRQSTFTGPAASAPAPATPAAPQSSQPMLSTQRRSIFTGAPPATQTPAAPTSGAILRDLDGSIWSHQQCELSATRMVIFDDLVQFNRSQREPDERGGTIVRSYQAVEKITASTDRTLATVTQSEPGTAVGTRWLYTLSADKTKLRVDNQTEGSSTIRTKCSSQPR